MIKMPVFEVVGEFPMGRKVARFRKLIKALKKEHALERVYSEIGSKHGVKRSLIKILDVKVVENGGERASE